VRMPGLHRSGMIDMSGPAQSGEVGADDGDGDARSAMDTRTQAITQTILIPQQWHLLFSCDPLICFLAIRP
jgi:hypothetical protein